MDEQRWLIGACRAALRGARPIELSVPDRKDARLAPLAGEHVRALPTRARPLVPLCWAEPPWFAWAPWPALSPEQHEQCVSQASRALVDASARVDLTRRVG